MSALDLGAFTRIYEAARCTHQAVCALDDGAAADRALHWLRLLDEHGVLHGWFAEEEHIPMLAKASACDDSDTDVGCQQGEHKRTTTHTQHGGGAIIGAGGASSSDASISIDTATTSAAQDGNSDECAICGLGGLLICCDACPRAYHAECIGHEQPADDDESDWFCPPCSRTLEIAA